jgi:hypothetical protein
LLVTNSAANENKVPAASGGYLAKMAKTTKITAIRDIEFLVNHQVLKRVDAGRNTSYEVLLEIEEPNTM